ncbi:MAG: MIP/aquaporin family protein [Pseudomonadota bacterium]|nr:MIP/aquaporin family protein [Pseudomonadota bacterium]
MTHTLLQKVGAEFIGTAGLLATVIGSGIMGETLAGGNVAIALLGNTIATGAILVVLIWVFGPISGAHFNPAVTIAFLVKGEISARDAAIFIVVQVLGALVGMLVAHGMFDLALIQESTKVRTGIGQWFAEGVATFGLVATIFGCIRARPDAVAMAVGLYITAGYWFTASTSFANPAVTIARSFTDTFSGIQPANAPAFIGMQIVGAILAVLVIGWLWRDAADD